MGITKLLTGFRRGILHSGTRNYASIPSSQINETKTSNSIISQGLSKQFKDALPSILNKVYKESPAFAFVKDRIWQVTLYNVGWGKNLRCWLHPFAYEKLAQPENVTQESMEQVYAVAWAVEMVNAWLLISDDVMDTSETRRGQPCWYRVPEGGCLAANDVSLLHSLAYEVLKLYVRDEPSYTDILDVFDKMCFYTCVGQHIDGAMSQENNDYANFTMNKFYPVADFKASYYSFQVPIQLAMFLTFKADPDSLRLLNDLCRDLGRFYQYQNDYYDCYGSGVSGKVGTDIEEGRCTWLAITALQRCNPAQRKEFTECYGSWDPEHVARIKRLYGELQVPQSYKEMEKAFCTNYPRQLHALEGRSSLKPEIFLKLVEVVKNTYEKV